MTYSRIAIPRIYTDWINWELTTGKMATTDLTQSGITSTDPIEMFDLNPSNVITIGGSGTSTQHAIKINTNITTDSYMNIDFCAILGHNFKQADVKFKLQTDDASGFGSPQTPDLTEVVNIGGDTTGEAYATPANNGWSLFTFSQSTDNQYIRLLIDPGTENYDADIKIGAILLGSFYDFPHRADLKLSRNNDFDNDLNGARGGKRFSNLKHKGSADWFVNQWRLTTGTGPDSSRYYGRRIYDLNFSYIDDTEMQSNDFNLNDMYLDTGKKFYNSVTNKIFGSHFPFIFQPDNTNATATSGFVFARMTSLKETQTGVNLWNIQMKLEEEF